MKLSPAERREAVRLLHSHGLSDAGIGDRLGLSARQTLRIRQSLQLPANFDSGRASA